MEIKKLGFHNYHCIVVLLMVRDHIPYKAPARVLHSHMQEVLDSIMVCPAHLQYLLQIPARCHTTRLYRLRSLLSMMELSRALMSKHWFPCAV